MGYKINKTKQKQKSPKSQTGILGQVGKEDESGRRSPGEKQGEYSENVLYASMAFSKKVVKIVLFK